MTKNPKRRSRKTKPADKPKPGFKLKRGMGSNTNAASERLSELPQHAAPPLIGQRVSQPEPPVSQPEVAFDGAATKNVASDAEQSSAASFPGEILENTNATSVEDFAAKISAAWHRTVNSVMVTAQFCADADAQLTLQQKKELIGKLPFGEETFSKLVGIGNDLRLREPEIQRRLPPHYTTIYVITTFNEDEFRLAVGALVIHAEVKRSELEQWRDEHRERVAALPVESNTAETAQKPAENRAAPESDVQGEVPAPTEAPPPATPFSPEPTAAAAADVTPSSTMVPPTGADGALPDEASKGEENRKAEGRRQTEEHRLAFQDICADLERERDEWQARCVALSHELGREVEPIPTLPNDAAPTSIVNLDRALGAVLLARGFDPTTAKVTAAINHLVEAALAQQR